MSSSRPSVEEASKNYEKFDPETYYEQFYKAAEGDYAHATYPIFPKMIKKMKNFPKKAETVLDLGTGPIVYGCIVIRDIADSFYLSDYNGPSKEILKKWITKEKLPFNFDYIAGVIKNAEESSETVENMQEKARNKMKAILDVNIFDDRIITGTYWRKRPKVEIPDKFDMVMSHFCLTNVCQTKEGFEKAVKNTVHLIKDGGFLCLAGYLSFTGFTMAGIEYKNVGHSLSDILTALEKAGMCTEEGEDFALEQVQFQPDNYQELESEIFLISRKLSKM